MVYPLPTNLYSTCDGVLYCLAEWAYNVTNGAFWVMMLVAFVMILFISTQRLGNARSFGFASIMGLFGATWLATLQLMSWWISAAFILLGASGFAVLILNEK